MNFVLPVSYILLILGVSHGDLCSYDETTPSEYVTCLSIIRRPPYACESNGGSDPDIYQIHILETDLDKVQDYDEENPPEIVVVIKPLSSFLEITQTVVLVFHAFKRVTWRVYTEHIPLSTNFIIKSSYPLIIDPSSILSNFPVDIMTTLPRDSTAVIKMIESFFDTRVTSFSGFHEGTRINWSIGPVTGESDNACTIEKLSFTKRLKIFKEIPVQTSGCTVPAAQGFNTHIIDIASTTDTKFPLHKHSATLIVKSKVQNEEFFGSNVVLILKSKKNIEWTIDTSGMDGNVLVVTNGNSDATVQSNLRFNSVGMAGFPDLEPQDFISYVSRKYGVVASYSKAEMANHIVIEVPEVLIHGNNGGNTTEQPVTDPLPDVEEIKASLDGQKSVNCYKSKVTVSWPISLLDSLYVDDVYFSQGPNMESCGLQVVGSQGMLLSGYDDCGHSAVHQQYSSVYSAKIAVMLNDGRSSEIDVECRIYNISKLETTSNDALYHLSIFGDADYTTQFDEFSVRANGYVYFRADLKEISDPNMSAVVEECFVSPTPHNFLDRHVLITQTCPLDASIHFLNQNYVGIRDEPSQKIKFQINPLFMKSDNYYLHCKVSMCSKIMTPDIAMCSSLYQMCKRDPPAGISELPAGFERDYILAGPIHLENNTVPAPADPDSGGRSEGYETDPCVRGGGGDSHTRGRTTISLGLLIGIALGSFALGIILTVFTIHCVSVSKSRNNKLPPTDVFRFENRSDTMYESLKLYDVCPQGHHLNRTTGAAPEHNENIPPAAPV